MSNINERIALVRKESKESQRSFGARIGISGPSVAHLESGINNPSEQTIRAICQEFGIRRGWLEHGEGPMKREPADDDELIDEVLAGEDEFIKAVIRGIARTPGGWEKMRDVFNAIQAELDKEKEPEA